MFKKNHTVNDEVHCKEFRVAIFGSARIKKDDKVYKQVFQLAEEIAKHKFDVVTGGGPGLMEAANAGHENGDKKQKSDSIGLIIKLPWESKGNKHLEIKTEYKTFAKRLDAFMDLSKIMIVMPGGIGTCLEFFYTLQLIQVKHIKPIPIILVGKMWEELIQWIKKYPLKEGLISPKDLDQIHIAKTQKETMEIILKTFNNYKRRKNK